MCKSCSGGGGGGGGDGGGGGGGGGGERGEGRRMTRAHTVTGRCSAKTGSLFKESL
jgi:hypothetical protein